MSLPSILLNLIQRLLMLGWGVSAAFILMHESMRAQVHGTGWPAETSWALMVMGGLVIFFALIGLVRGVGFKWVHGLGIFFWVAMLVETMVWQDHATKVCAQLRQDAFCELKNDGYHCKKGSLYGEADFPTEFCEVKKLSFE